VVALAPLQLDRRGEPLFAVAVVVETPGRHADGLPDLAHPDGRLAGAVERIKGFSDDLSAAVAVGEEFGIAATN
jgi:hypothetical protein